MKKSLIIVAVLLIGVTTISAKKKKNVDTLKPVATVDTVLTPTQQKSYALGANIGEGVAGNFEKLGLKIDKEIFLKGLSDAMDKKNKLTPEQMTAAFQALDAEVTAMQDSLKGLEKAFLVKNKTNAGVIETESGLQYKVITMGTGAKPKATDEVKVHYHGTTIDGKVFDSSVERGEPITFPLNQVIPGWTEGVQLMPVGSKFIFYIPSELAYGEQGAGNGSIKSGATLIFEVELLEIMPQTTEPTVGSK